MRGGCVIESRSLLPRSSFAQSRNRVPRKSSSARRARWIIVPLAPSSMRILALRRAASFAECSGIFTLDPQIEKPAQLSPETGLDDFRRISLAAFITRPQAEHQIGASTQCAHEAPAVSTAYPYNAPSA